MRVSTKVGAPRELIIEAQKQAVYHDVHNTILSEVNKSSNQEVMKLAQKANQEQFKRTGVLLNQTALLAIVYKINAEFAERGIKKAQ